MGKHIRLTFTAENISIEAELLERQAPIPFALPGGLVVMNIFARIVGDPEAFYAACYRMRREGAKALKVERVG